MSGAWRLPGYAEVETLGEGGFGRVVLAKHEPSGQFVAIKYLRPDLLARPEIAESFRHEAYLLHSVHSPHVARLHDYVATPEGAALVMEAVPGVSLRTLLAAENALAPEAALAILKGSLLGLAAAHAANVVHRDYKPANVLVSPQRESKLIDFGLAILDGQVGLAAGSPAYMAPEQWAGRPGTPSTDVYAATCVFFQCVTGRRPFEAETTEQYKTLHAYAPVPAADVPEPLRPLIVRGMAKDPTARPATADAFVTELEATARVAYGDDWEERGWQRLAAAVGALVALTPLALIAAAGTATAPVAAGTAGTAAGGGFVSITIAKVVGAVLAVTALVVGGVVIYNQVNEDAPPPQQQAALSVEIETLTQQQSDPPFAVDAQYARVTGHSDPAIQERLNAALRAPVDEYLREARETAEGNRADLSDAGEVARATIKATVTLQTPDVISVRYDNSFGSNGVIWHTSWNHSTSTNVSPQSGAVLRPHDLFRPETLTAQGMRRLTDVVLSHDENELCTETIDGRPVSLDKSAQEPGAEHVPATDFALTPSGIDFVVRYDRLGCPTAAGRTVVGVPYRELEWLLTPDWLRKINPAPTNPWPTQSAPSSTPASSTSAPSSPAPSSPPADGDYTTYTDQRFGFTCPVPPGYTETRNGNVTVFTDADGTAALTLRGTNNTDGAAADELLAAAVADLERTGAEVTHESSDGQSYTISGYLADRRIFYERTFVGSGSTAGLRWVYPQSQKAAFDAPVTRTAEEFQPGDLTKPH